MKIEKFIEKYNCCITPPPGKEWEDLGREMETDLLKVIKQEQGKRNKQLLTLLRSAKRIIKIWYDKGHGDMVKYFWDEYQEKPVMKRINKAIKDV